MLERDSRHIVRGQNIANAKHAAAKVMRSNMTPAETALWQQLRGNQFEGIHFRRQQVIDGFIADFYCHKAALAIEIDGAYHRADYDQERDAILAARKVTTLRFTNDEIANDIEDVLKRILQAVKNKNQES